MSSFSVPIPATSGAGRERSDSGTPSYLSMPFLCRSTVSANALTASSDSSPSVLLRLARDPIVLIIMER